MIMSQALSGKALSQRNVVDSPVDGRAEERKKKSEELTLVLGTGISSVCGYFTFLLICRHDFLFKQWLRVTVSFTRGNQSAWPTSY